MKNHKFTIVGMAIGFGLLFITFAFKIDFFEIVTDTLMSFEHYEIDEFIIPLLVIVFFASFDQFRKQKLQKIEQEKVKIYKAMLSSSHHILKNFLNQMQLFKFTAENTPDFDAETLALYDVVIEDTLTQLDALGSISKIDEASIFDSVVPKK